MTVRRLIQFYIDNHINRDRVADPARIIHALNNVRRHFGRQHPKNIRITHVEKYIEQRARAGIRTGTIRYELGRLVTVLNFAVRHRELHPSECPNIPLPSAPEPADRWLTKAECLLLLSVARHLTNPDGVGYSRLELFLWIALETGARPGFIRKLKWDQVDVNNGRIDWYNGGRRTKKRRPVVPVSDDLMPILKQAHGVRTSPYVLGHPGSLRRQFSRCCQMAQLSGVTPKVLRHTWATHAAQAGVSLWDIAGVLGNTLAVVEKTYAHHCPDHLRAAVNFRAA